MSMGRLLRASVAATAIVGLGAMSAQASVGESPRACAQTDGRVNAVVVDGGTTYLGGQFTHVTDRYGRQLARTRLAAVDTATCAVLPWAPAANAEVLALAVSASNVYAGGRFTTVNGASRPYLAALDRGTGAPQALSGAPNNTVRALALSGTRLYVGGEFTRVGVAVRNRLASFSAGTGAVDTGWKPSANGKVYALASSSGGDRVYVGGTFTALNGMSSTSYLGAVNATSGAVDSSFLPRAGFPVATVAADSRGVYVGGGGSGGHLGIWNLNGSLQRPIYQTDGGVQSITVDGDSLYAGGHFTNYCVGNTGSGSPYVCDKPLSRRKAFEISLSTGSLTSWSPTLNSAHGVFGSDVDPATHDLWAGGDFTKVNGTSVARLAVFP
jgi:hypothetical protein